jgi:hypothetical protein
MQQERRAISFSLEGGLASNVSVARLQVDTRKWAAARLAPKKYGDRVEHDHKGLSFQPAVLVQIGGVGEREPKTIEGNGEGTS